MRIIIPPPIPKAEHDAMKKAGTVYCLNWRHIGYYCESCRKAFKLYGKKEV